MKNNSKLILNEEERKKLIEHAAKIHQIVEEISGKKKHSKFEFLKHPLIILGFSALIIHFLIPSYQKRLANLEENVKARYQIMRKSTPYVERVIAMAENVVYLHRKPIKNKEQIIDTNKSFNAAFDEFNSNFSRIAYELKIISDIRDAYKEWKSIKEELNELNSLLDFLHEFPTSDISIEHAKRIESCNQKVEDIKEKWEVFLDLMI